MSSHPMAPSGPPSSGDGEGASRFIIRGIDEVKAPPDHELAVIFREMRRAIGEMRRAIGVSQEQIAGWLETSVETVEALESGLLLDLPEWTELNRVVDAYAAELGLDLTPILRRLESGLEAAKPAAEHSSRAAGPPPRTGPAPSRPPIRPGGPPMPPAARQALGSSSVSISGTDSGKAPPQAPVQPARKQRPAPAETGATAKPETEVKGFAPEQAVPKDAKAKPKPRRAPKVVGAVVNWILLIGFVAALGTGVWYAAQNPRTVWKAVDGLPEPVPRLVRSAWELVRPHEDSSKSGNQSNSSGRRSDKLP